MGLGKTFTGSEKMLRLGGRVNLVICQKSKVSDWVEHFKQYYSEEFNICNLTSQTFWKNGGIKTAIDHIGISWGKVVFVINYDLVFRRPELLKLEFDTIMLDESSMIQNDRAKRTKAILKMKTDLFPA